MIHRDVVVGHAQGIHALVAHDLARQAERFRSSIFLRTPEGSASLRSVVEVVALALPYGAKVSVWVDGTDEAEALDAIALHLSSST
ncbi:HPr family phosphocarrier protein [Raineyella fluvialis]|uniref:HPr family phosphocarrier protein n=1 Tax=Raineyella fluvialis TaxID=2662261 RepID=A0A5Q2FG19_9ACTN|nr:HPr family phosphocarrier protein [Raineyella fluvialis]QGF23236.1 HPr family phosphocarrier protein [Raineyella fluvialis]